MRVFSQCIRPLFLHGAFKPTGYAPAFKRAFCTDPPNPKKLLKAYPILLRDLPLLDLSNPFSKKKVSELKEKDPSFSLDPPSSLLPIKKVYLVAIESLYKTPFHSQRSFENLLDFSWTAIETYPEFFSNELLLQIKAISPIFFETLDKMLRSSY